MDFRLSSKLNNIPLLGSDAECTLCIDRDVSSLYPATELVCSK